MNTGIKCYFPGSLDFSQHRGSHPTLGSVDHVCFSPIDDSEEAIHDTIEIADNFCHKIIELNDHHLPVFSYGRLSLSGQRLRDIRRSLNYFKSNGKQLLEKDIITSSSSSSLTTGVQLSMPSYGTLSLEHCYDLRKGVMCVGVVPFVQNFNIQIECVRKVDGSRTLNEPENLRWKSKVFDITKRLRSADVSILSRFP
jgi:hypothetical protein